LADLNSKLVLLEEKHIEAEPVILSGGQIEMPTPAKGWPFLNRTCKMVSQSRHALPLESLVFDNSLPYIGLAASQTKV
jgi:hypothetical protein